MAYLKGEVQRNEDMWYDLMAESLYIDPSTQARHVELQSTIKILSTILNMSDEDVREPYENQAA